MTACIKKAYIQGACNCVDACGCGRWLQHTQTCHADKDTPSQVCKVLDACREKLTGTKSTLRTARECRSSRQENCACASSGGIEYACFARDDCKAHDRRRTTAIADADVLPSSNNLL